MTNKEYLNTLSPEKRAECEKTYSKGVYPLYDYIDWNAYWNSEDGNALHFLNYVRKYKDEFDREYVVLKEDIVKDDMDYMLVYSFTDDEFQYIPMSDDEVPVRLSNDVE